MELEGEGLNARLTSLEITYNEANEQADTINQRNLEEYRKTCEKEIDEMLEWERKNFWCQDDFLAQEKEKSARKKSGAPNSDANNQTQTTLQNSVIGTPERHLRRADHLTQSTRRRN